MKFDQKNCMPPKTTPQTNKAGQTASAARIGHKTRTSQKGKISVVSGRMRPIMALKSASGKPVTAASVRTGLPMPPNATGAEFAMRHIMAVWNGGKPKPIIMAPVMATGAPPPPAPSSRAPKAKAISSAWSRRSAVTLAMDCLAIANCPDSTETSYTNTAVTTIQAMRIQP